MNDAQNRELTTIGSRINSGVLPTMYRGARPRLHYCHAIYLRRLQGPRPKSPRTAARAWYLSDPRHARRVTHFYEQQPPSRPCEEFAPRACRGPSLAPPPPCHGNPGTVPSCRATRISPGANARHYLRDAHGRQPYRPPVPPFKENRHLISFVLVDKIPDFIPSERYYFLVKLLIPRYPDIWAL